LHALLAGEAVGRARFDIKNRPRLHIDHVIVQFHLAAPLQNIVNLCAFLVVGTIMDEKSPGRLAVFNFLLVLLAAPGCGQAQSGTAVKSSHAADAITSHIDLSAYGTIRGQVNWNGEIPNIADYEILPNLLGGEVFHKKQTRPNPNAPVINSLDRGVAGAVVFLRGVDTSRAKPWSCKAVTVEQRDGQFHVLQDGVDSRIGFVRRGERIKMVSRDRFLYCLHADGVEFFSLIFPDPDQPLERSLNRSGTVELMSGNGYFWMRAYLFVDDHPYYARTDAHGYFDLRDVPPGRYDLVCWMSNWSEARHDRDPESRLISRMYFRPPVEVAQSVIVNAKESRRVDFFISLKAFQGGG